MTTRTCDLRVGATVSLVVTWGTQQRLRCPSCHHYTSGAAVVFCGCGALYSQIDGTTNYRVESLP